VSNNNDCPIFSTTTNSGENNVQKLLQRLPRNLNKDKEATKREKVSPSKKLECLVEEQEDEQEEDNEDNQQQQQQQQQPDDSDEGLVVAWQYRKHVQEQRLGGISLQQQSRSNSNSSSSGTRAPAIFCHSYDLQGKLMDQISEFQPNIVAIGDRCSCQQWCNTGKNQSDDRMAGLSLFKQLVHIVQSFTTSNPNKVIRILFQDCSIILSELQVALPLFLNYIRQRSLPVVVFITVPPETLSSSPSQQQRAAVSLQRCVDVVLETESFTGRKMYPPAPEFREFHGLLRVRKASTLTLASTSGHFADRTVQKQPIANIFGLKRDRRKLNISLLHIPPEDYAAHGSSVGEGAVRSGAGRPLSAQAVVGCASGDGSSSLDF
jgi:hypothetical protein